MDQPETWVKYMIIFKQARAKKEQMDLKKQREKERRPGTRT